MSSWIREQGKYVDNNQSPSLAVPCCSCLVWPNSAMVEKPTDHFTHCDRTLPCVSLQNLLTEAHGEGGELASFREPVKIVWGSDYETAISAHM